MNQKIALVVYPEFSFQEIGNLSSLFRSGPKKDLRSFQILRMKSSVWKNMIV